MPIVRPICDGDGPWVRALLCEKWGSTVIVTRGTRHDAARLPGFVAVEGDRLVGLVTYRVDGDACEIVSLNSLLEGRGIGTALVDAVGRKAGHEGCRRVWLVTTNDNTAALRFWQRRGFRLVALRRNALVESRRLKPQIPLVGHDGIPILDELELGLILPGGTP